MIGPLLLTLVLPPSPCAGRTIAQGGCEPILHMRAFQKGRKLPQVLVDDIVSRNAHGMAEGA
jgi:hypothetical protein